MTTLYLILLLLSTVFFALSAFGVVVSKVNLMALGLFCWVLVPLIQTIKVM